MKKKISKRFKKLLEISKNKHSFKIEDVISKVKKIIRTVCADASAFIIKKIRKTN